MKLILFVTNKALLIHRALLRLLPVCIITIMLIFSFFFSNASTLQLIINDSIPNIEVIKYNNYLLGNKELVAVKKSSSGRYNVVLNNDDTVGIILRFNSRWSYPYYITPNSNDTIQVVIDKLRIKILTEESNFNYAIQFFENTLFALIPESKREVERKLELLTACADSLVKDQQNLFVRKSIIFQRYAFSVAQYEKYRFSDKELLQLVSKLPVEELDPRIAAMMAFFMTCNEKLWHCSQHVNYNKSFLFVPDKQRLREVIFKQKIFKVEDYERLSYLLKIKLIESRGYYHGSRTDLIELADSLRNTETNQFLKVLYNDLFHTYGLTNKEEYLNLKGYSFTDKNFQTVSLDSFLGKPILIDFWATWCKPCIAGFSMLDKIHKKYGNELIIVSLNVDDNIDKMIGFLDKRGELGWVFLYTGLNESVMSRFGVVSYPHYALIDQRGNIIQKRLPNIHGEEFDKLIKEVILNRDK